jgi:predicted component of type VI protein secretion system
MRAQLILESENGIRREGRLRDGAYLVGRSRSCQIRPPYRSISRRHCIVLNTSRGISVVDLGSVAGTFVNGTLLTPGVESPLKDGDQLRVGEVAFLVAVQTGDVLDSFAGSSAHLELGEIEAESPVSPEGSSSRPMTPLSGDSNDISPMAGDDVATWLMDLDETDRGERLIAIKQRFSGSAESPDLEDLDFDTDLRDVPAEPSMDVEPSQAQEKEREVRRAPPPAKPKPTGPGLVATLLGRFKENPDSAKLAALAAVLLALGCWSIWYAYTAFFAGPAVKIYSDI